MNRNKLVELLRDAASDMRLAASCLDGNGLCGEDELKTAAELERAADELEQAEPVCGAMPLDIQSGKPFTVYPNNEDWHVDKLVPLYAVPQHVESAPFSWPLLDAPAKVGGVVIGKGCSSRHVVMIAKRQYQYEVETPPEEIERRKKALQGVLDEVWDRTTD
ncbi:MAG: hypothetical protein WC997_02250 [Porticoccaceae bacterium]